MDEERFSVCILACVQSNELVRIPAVGQFLSRAVGMVVLTQSWGLSSSGDRADTSRVVCLTGKGKDFLSLPSLIVWLGCVMLILEVAR